MNPYPCLFFSRSRLGWAPHLAQRNVVTLAVCLLVGCDPSTKPGSKGENPPSHSRSETIETAASNAAPDKPKAPTTLNDAELKKKVEEAIIARSISIDEHQLQELFNQSPARMALVLKNLALEKKDGGIIEILGKLCGRSAEFKKEAPQWMGENLKGSYLEWCYRGFAYGLASPDEVVEFMGTLDHGGPRDHIACVAIEAFAKDEPQKAYELYLKEHDSMKAGDASLSEDSGFVVARAFLDKLPQDKMEAFVMDKGFLVIGLENPGNVARLLGEKYPELAVKWALSLEGEDARNNALVEIADSQILNANTKGFSELISQASQVISEKKLIDLVVQSQMQENSDWVKELPPSDLDAKLFQSAAERLPAKFAEEWLRPLDAGQRRDGAVLGLINSLVHTDVNAAAKWAASMQDETLRNQAQSIIQSAKPQSP